MDMKDIVLVTGANGFAGRNLIRYLSACGYAVHGVSRRGGTSDKKEHFAIDQLGDQDELASLLRKRKITALVHAAGRINGTPEELREANQEFTRRVVRAVEAVASETKFVYISSVSAEAGAKGEYAEAKRACEEVIIDSRLSRWSILRPSLLYGPGDTKNVARLIAAAQHWPVIPVPGAAWVKLQPLYIDDLGGAVSAVLERNEWKRSYTVAGPRQEYLRDMIRMIQRRAGRRQPLISIPVKPIQWVVRIARHVLPGGLVPSQQIMNLHDHPMWDWSAARRDLGFAPRTFEEGIAEFL
ncbi:MAG: NAD(P)-dependent oxidoreductase [Nitrospira sp.]|nr:NAD(P)-dependent oxidoreductase [Nitrospira sp.]